MLGGIGIHQHPPTLPLTGQDGLQDATLPFMAASGEDPRAPSEASWSPEGWQLVTVWVPL